jgi:DNA-binding beta-propeller fold protein YncE
VIYVSDTANNHRIDVFDNNGRFLANWGSLGAGNGQFDRPDGTIFDPATKLIYVSDRKNNRVQVLDNDGRFVTTLTIDTANKNILVKPRNVAIDSSGKVLVMDKENNKIYAFIRSSNSTT